MNLILEYDDFHSSGPENCLEMIQTLVGLYPEIIINLFTVPNLRNVPIYKDWKFCDEVRDLIQSGHLVIGVHGTNHDFLEFEELSREASVQKLLLSEKILTEANLPFVRVFRGPNWGLGLGCIEALHELEYTHVYNHDNHQFLDGDISSCGMKTVYYNWNLKDKFGKSTEPAALRLVQNLYNCPENQKKDIWVVGHGHTHNVCSNGIVESLPNLIDFLDSHNPTFRRLDEWVEFVPSSPQSNYQNEKIMADKIKNATKVGVQDERSV